MKIQNKIRINSRSLSSADPSSSSLKSKNLLACSVLLATLTTTLGLQATTSRSAQVGSNFFSNSNCGKQIQAKAQKLQSLNQWTRHIDPAPGRISYRTPTKDFGVWLEYRKNPDQSTELIRIQTGGVEFTHWKKNQCDQPDVKSLSKRVLARDKNGRSYFFDDDLKNLMNRQKKGLIYLWSPGEIESITRQKSFSKMAERLNLPMTSLMDPEANEKNTKQRLSKLKVPLSTVRAQAVELKMRGSRYPAFAVFSNGKIGDQLIAASDETPEIEDQISRALRELQ